MCYGVHYENIWIPNDFVCLLICTGRGSEFGDSPKYKETLPNFFGKYFLLGLLAGHASDLGHDRNNQISAYFEKHIGIAYNFKQSRRERKCGIINETITFSKMSLFILNDKRYHILDCNFIRKSTFKSIMSKQFNYF